MNVQQAAIRALGALGARSQSDRILELAENPDSPVWTRLAAVDVLSAFEPGRWAAVLDAVIDRSTPELRSYLPSQIVAHGGAQRTRLLRRLLRDEDPSVRKAAFETVDSWDLSEHLPDVIPMLADRDVSACLARWITGEHVPAILPFLASESAVTVRNALESLAVADCPEAVPIVARLLRRPELRADAGKWLTRRADPESIKPLVDLLGDPDETAPWAAAETLAALGAAEVVPYLEGRLQRPDSSAALLLLARLRSPAAGPRLLELVKDPDAGARALGLEGLQSMGHPEAFSRSLALLADPAPEPKAWAAVGVASLGNARDHAAALAPLLRDESCEVRCAALQAFRDLQGTDIPGDAVALLKDNNSTCRTLAVEIILQAGNKDALAACLPLLSADESEASIIDIMDRLIVQDYREAAPALQEALGHVAETVRIHAIDALVRLKGPTALPDVVMMLDDEEEDVRDFARAALVRLDTPMAFEALAADLSCDPSSEDWVWELYDATSGEARAFVHALARHPERELRLQACHILARWRDRSVVPELLRYLGDPDTAGRAADALGEMATPEAIPKLAELAASGPKETRCDAIRALRVSGDPGALPPILDLLEDGNADVRREAARAAMELGAPEAIPALVPFLDDEHETTRHWTMELLVEHHAKEAGPRLKAWMQSGTPRERWTALKHVDDAKVAEAFLSDRNEFLRYRAAHVLTRRGSAAGLSVLRKTLDHPFPPLAASAAWDLALRGDGESVPSIERAVRRSTGRRWQLNRSRVDLDLLESDSYQRSLEALAVLAPARARAIASEFVGMHSSQVAVDSVRLIAFLADPGDHDLLLRGLAHPHGEVRMSAAEGLCRLGSKRGIQELVNGGAPSFFAMNALRSPDLWKRWGEPVAPERIEGTRHHLLETLTGLPLELSPLIRVNPRWLNDIDSHERHLLRSSIRDAVERVYREYHELILEPDRVRILPRGEALKFWRDWAAGR